MVFMVVFAVALVTVAEMGAVAVTALTMFILPLQIQVILVIQT
jgi:hypothetical protein